MASLQQALARLQEYSSRVDGPDEATATSPEVESAYAGRLEKSLQSLQRQLNEHEAALEKLRATSPIVSIEKPDEDIASRIRQLRTITAAYKSNTSADPLLPSSDSPLPALLSLRSTLRAIEEIKTAVRVGRGQISEAHSKFRLKEADLQDARRVTVALEERAEKLRLEKEEIERDGTEETIARFLRTHEQKDLLYTEELKKLVVAFNKFVDEHLAMMLAAEQLGGPVAGDNKAINETMLKAGFDKQGKVKKARVGKNNGDGDAMDIDVGESERKAAGAGLRKLTEELLNALADDENPESYIAISKETAGVRFLIRAKVAQFHPHDSRKLRLMDFGTEAADLS